MRKWIYRIVLAVLLAVFLISLGAILSILHQYRQSAGVYEDAVRQFVQPSRQTAAEPVPADRDPAEEASEIAGKTQRNSETDSQAGAEQTALELAPIQVNFAALQAINPDIAGWIYCPDTNINYPVMKGADNDFYLHRSYDRSYLFTGSIFVEELNQPQFLDFNTIIYGHNMRDGSMFAALEDWDSQAYYEAHPVMWLLTPEQDYKVVLFSEYTTSAYSEAYQIFNAPGPDLDAYLETARRQSNFETDVALDPAARYVLLSTCAYVFDGARYVLHGMLVPLDSAGGTAIRAAGRSTE